MEKSVDRQPERSGDNEDGISLTDVLRPFWIGRKSIIIGTTLALIIGFAGLKYFEKYESEGFFQFGGPIPLTKGKDVDNKEPGLGMALSDYKRYSAVFSTGERLEEFIKQNKVTDATSARLLHDVFGSRDGISKIVEPVYSFTKLDAKELMDQPKDAVNNVIGLRVHYATSDPVEAQRLVGLLGLYAMDGIIYFSYADSLRFKQTEITAKITKFDNDIISLNARLAEYQRRGVALKMIVSRYPDSASEAARQVISVTPDNARYLSPVTHLMATEVEATQASEEIIRVQREQQQAMLLRDYYDAAKLVFDSEKTGINILAALEPLKERVFGGKNMKDDLVKEVYNTISIENKNAISLYLEKSRFIAGPSLPSRPTSKLLASLLASFFIGLILSMAFVIGRNWWEDNRIKMEQ